MRYLNEPYEQYIRTGRPLPKFLQEIGESYESCFNVHEINFFDKNTLYMYGENHDEIRKALHGVLAIISTLSINNGKPCQSFGYVANIKTRRAQGDIFDIRGKRILPSTQLRRAWITWESILQLIKPYHVSQTIKHKNRSFQATFFHETSAREIISSRLEGAENDLQKIELFMTGFVKTQDFIQECVNVQAHIDAMCLIQKRDTAKKVLI